MSLSLLVALDSLYLITSQRFISTSLSQREGGFARASCLGRLDFAAKRLETVSVLWLYSTEIFRAKLSATGADFNALGLDLLLSILLTGIILCCLDDYRVFASFSTRFNVRPEHLAISSSVSLPSSNNFKAILSFSLSAASFAAFDSRSSK